MFPFNDVIMLKFGITVFIRVVLCPVDFGIFVSRVKLIQPSKLLAGSDTMAVHYSICYIDGLEPSGNKPVPDARVTMIPHTTGGH